MKELVQIELRPLDKVLQVERGSALRDVLFSHGVEFPCGGKGRCKGCKIKVLSGTLSTTAEDQERLSSKELSEGWRLACRALAVGNLKIDLAQWEATILSDDSIFDFHPRQGLGVAVDLGTTTIVAQLLDLQTGQVLAVEAALNEQARHGADIMSRVEFAVSANGQPELQLIIRDQIRLLIQKLLGSAALEGPTVIESVVIVGNTVMHHLFCGISVEPLSHYPFEPESSGLQVFAANTLGWAFDGNPQIHFMPCLGGFVGSDLLAGVLATKLHQRDSLNILIDLGTNGEIVLGNRKGLLCAATAAGPAFEGARISMGMRAATGAISEVHYANNALHCHILGHAPPRGICGSGLVDAVACGLDLGWILPNGRLARGEPLELTPPVSLNQWDIRELQLAKGAIAAGVRLLLQEWGATMADVDQLFLAGAFGNYINQTNARRIGLLSFPSERIVASGNTALLGAKLALFSLTEHDPAYPDIVACTKHISLNEAPAFQEVYVQEMAFP